MAGKEDGMDNDAVAMELSRIKKENGGIIPAEAVVDAARPKKSPLHSHFEWDDSEAAEKWRVHQARNLIRVYVGIIETPNGPKESRVYVSLTKDRGEGGGYRSITDVMGNQEWRAQLLEDALAEMRSFKLKYAVLKELAEVFAAMDSVKPSKELVA